MAFLLDANVLIALTVPEHAHHRRSVAWAVGVDQMALCAFVEGALIRFLVRAGERTEVAIEVLRTWHAHPRVVLWADAPSYLDADLDHVRGHRQVTDAYLASLAARHDGSLATLDVGLAAARPDVVHLVPAA